LSYFVDDVVKRALQGVRNVAQVERIGGVEREILVSLDPDRLQAAGLTAVDVSRRLRAPMSTSPAGAPKSARTTRRSARWPAPRR